MRSFEHSSAFGITKLSTQGYLFSTGLKMIDRKWGDAAFLRSLAIDYREAQAIRMP